MHRVGLGVDSHRFTDKTVGKSMVLGGVKIYTDIMIKANSDGDVILHSICNAISQALGGGSFSIRADKLCQAGVVNSKYYVDEFIQEMKDNGFRLVNVGINIEAGKPRLEKYGLKIRASVAKILEIESSQVGLTITSGEGLSDCGKGLGIMSSVVVLLEGNG